MTAVAALPHLDLALGKDLCHLHITFILSDSMRLYLAA